MDVSTFKYLIQPHQRFDIPNPCSYEIIKQLRDTTVPSRGTTIIITDCPAPVAEDVYVFTLFQFVEIRAVSVKAADKWLQLLINFRPAECSRLLCIKIIIPLQKQIYQTKKIDISPNWECMFVPSDLSYTIAPKCKYFLYGLPEHYHYHGIAASTWNQKEWNGMHHTNSAQTHGIFVADTDAILWPQYKDNYNIHDAIRAADDQWMPLPCRFLPEVQYIQRLVTTDLVVEAANRFNILVPNYPPSLVLETITRDEIIKHGVPFDTLPSTLIKKHYGNHLTGVTLDVLGCDIELAGKNLRGIGYPWIRSDQYNGWASLTTIDDSYDTECEMCNYMYFDE